MRNILVVDSDCGARQNLVSGLRRYKEEFHVLEAENGQTAAQMLGSSTVDLLITELDMPVMDGFELLAYVLRHQPRTEVIVTSNSDGGRIGQALTAEGAFHYLPKPVAIDGAVQLIHELLLHPARGPVTGLSLAGFLQLLNSERKTCSLSVKALGTAGRVDVQDGDVIHAVCGDQQGKPALYQLLNSAEPELETGEAVSPVVRTVDTQLPRLLLEASLWRDRQDRSSPATLRHPQEGLQEPVVGTAAPAQERPTPTIDLSTDPQVREELESALNLHGALGVAVVDVEKSQCVVSVSRDSDPRFAQDAVQGGAEARSRLQAMIRPRFSSHVKQFKVDQGRHLGLVRFIPDHPHLVLYYAGEPSRTNVIAVNERLEELQEYLVDQLTG